MNRQFLTGALTGAALVSVPTVIARFLSDGDDHLHVRIAEDSPLNGGGRDQPEKGPVSAAIIRACGMSQFTFDNFDNDHIGSSFFNVSDASTQQLNCVVGEARARHLAFAFSDGIDTSDLYQLPSDPVAYTRCQPTALVAGTCQTKKK